MPKQIQNQAKNLLPVLVHGRGQAHRPITTNDENQTKVVFQGCPHQILRKPQRTRVVCPAHEQHSKVQATVTGREPGLAGQDACVHQQQHDCDQGAPHPAEDNEAHCAVQAGADKGGHSSGQAQQGDIHRQDSSLAVFRHDLQRHSWIKQARQWGHPLVADALLWSSAGCWQSNIFAGQCMEHRPATVLQQTRPIEGLLRRSTLWTVKDTQGTSRT